MGLAGDEAVPSLEIGILYDRMAVVKNDYGFLTGKGFLELRIFRKISPETVFIPFDLSTRFPSALPPFSFQGFT